MFYVNRLTLRVDTEKLLNMKTSLKHLADVYQAISMRSLWVAPAHAAH